MNLLSPLQQIAVSISIIALSLMNFEGETKAAIIASDGGITLWISWDDLDNPG